MTMSSSSLHFPQILDDRDLDDAELWAVIDSATASRSSRKTPLLALTNSSHSPAPKPSRRPRNEIEASPRVSADGEVVQFQEERWPCRRPQKAARLADPGGDRQMVVVRHPPRPPVVTPPSPASSYASPVPGRHVVKQVSPVVESPPPPPTFDSWNGEEKENQRHSLSGRFPSVSLFKQYQNAAMAILEKTDYTMISGSPFIKKSGWRKISFFFNLSYEIKDKSIEFDENRNVQRAEFVVRAFMQGGRFSDGWGSCDRREKRFLKPNHDVPSTAETRAKNKACQDLLGIGEYRPGVKL